MALEMELKQLEDEIREHVSVFIFGQGFLGNLSNEDAEELVGNIMISVLKHLGEIGRSEND